MVTYPHGTTAEAIRHFDESSLCHILEQATRAAYEKAKELGSELE